MPASTRSPYAHRVLRGSLYTLRTKCGKTTCRCARGELHETPALSCSIRGSTKLLTLRPQDLREVRAALKRYRTELHRLNQEAVANIHELRQRIQREKARARKAKR